VKSGLRGGAAESLPMHPNGVLRLNTERTSTCLPWHRCDRAYAHKAEFPNDMKSQTVVEFFPRKSRLNPLFGWIRGFLESGLAHDVDAASYERHVQGVATRDVDDPTARPHARPGRSRPQRRSWLGRPQRVAALRRRSSHPGLVRRQPRRSANGGQIKRYCIIHRDPRVSLALCATPPTSPAHSQAPAPLCETPFRSPLAPQCGGLLPESRGFAAACRLPAAWRERHRRIQ
jgi:hypothetical protein